MLTPTRPWSRRGVSLIAALALSWSSLVLAAPGVVKRSTEARSAPFTVAPVVELVPAGAMVAADETTSNGWRRIQLPSGRFAFVHDEDVEVSPGDLPTPPPARPGEAAPVYVTSLEQLATITRTDPLVSGLADDLANRRAGSTTAIVLGALGGLLLHVLAETAFETKSCSTDFGSGSVCVTSTNRNLDLVGVSLLVAGPVFGWLIRPTRADETELVNAWNARHPLHPLLDGAAIAAP
jgi:hypothetical protein